MEREKKRTEDIKPLLLLLKVAIPLAFPLAGLVVSSLTTKNSRTKKKTQFISPPRHQMDSNISISHCEHGDGEGFHILDSSLVYEEKEEEEPAGKREEPLLSLQNSGSQEIMTEERSNDMREISINQAHDGPNLEEEIGTLKSQVTALQEKELDFDAQFYHYCSLKEQESAIQTLQIMCLGFKLELMEAQNQKLEGTIAQLRDSIEQVDMIKDELTLLQRKVKKLSRTNRLLHARLIRQQALNLDAREAELSKAKEELKHATKEIKDLADELHQGNKAVVEKLELRTMMNSSTSESEEEPMMTEEDDGTPRPIKKKLFDQLERFREQWYADMEEMMYLGWIGACLRHELLMDQEGAERPVGEMRDRLVVELPIDDRAKDCVVEFHDSDRSPSPSVGDASLDVAAMKHHLGPTKAKFLHKIRGWAKRKGRSKRWCDRDKGSERWWGSN